MNLYRNALIFAALSLITSPHAGFTQGIGSTPEQQKAALAGMTREQIKQKYMSLAFPNEHFSDSWPSNFPLPKYTSNVIKTKFSNTTKGRPSAAASLITKDSPQIVFAFYKDACQRGGWAIKTPSAKAMANTTDASRFFMLEGKKEKESIQLSCAPGPKNTATIVSIMWYKVR